MKVGKETRIYYYHYIAIFNYTGATPNFGDCVSSDTTNKTFSEVVTRCNGTENTLHDCGNITERNGCTCMVFFGMLVGRIRGRLQCQSGRSVKFIEWSLQ